MAGIQDLSDAELMRLAKPSAPPPALAEIPDDQLIAMAKGATSAAPEAPPESAQPPEKPWTRPGYMVGRGAVTGVLGMPVDLMNFAINTVVSPFGGHAPEKPIMGSEWLGEKLDAVQGAWDRLIGTPEVAGPPETAGERILHAMGSGAGSVIAPLAAVRALSTAAPAVEGSKVVGALTNFFKNPTARTLATETGLGAVSGAGAGVASEAFPGNPIAPLVGGFLAPGAVVAGRGALTAAGRGGQRLTAPFSVRSADDIRANPEAMTPGDRIAGQILRESATDPAAVTAPREPPPLEGLKPTLGHEIPDPGIAALEQAGATASPAPFVAQRSANNQVIRRAAEGASEGDPAAIAAEVERRKAGLLGTADRGVAAADRSAEEVLASAEARRRALLEQAEKGTAEAETATRQAVGETPGRTAASEALHRDIMARHAASEAAEREAWAPINAVRGLKFDTGPIKADVEALTKGLTRSERALLPETEMAILKDWGGVEPFGELTSIKSAIGSAKRKALREGDDNRARVIGMVERKLADHLENPLLLEGEHPLLTGDLLEKYKNARAVTRAQKEQFNTDTETAALFQRTGTGDVRVAPTETMARFVKPGPGGKEAAESLVRALGGPEVLEQAAAGQPTAINHVRDWAFADLQAKPLTSQNVAAWRDRYAGMLETLPTLRRDIDEIATRVTAQEGAAARGKLLSDAVADFEKKPPTIKGIEAWKAKHADALEAHPELKADADAIAQRLARQEQTAQRRQQLVDMLEKNAANKFTEGDPEWALGQLLKSKNLQANDRAVAEFTRFIKRSPEALEGARRTMIDLLTQSGSDAVRNVDAAGAKMLSSPAMLSFYEKNGRVFDALFTDKTQRDLVDRIVKAVRMNTEPGAGATATGGPNTAQKVAGVERFQKLAGDKYIDALVGGNMGKILTVAGAAVGSSHGPLGAAVGAHGGAQIPRLVYGGQREKIMDLVNEALRDPALARDLMREVTPRNDKIVGPRLIRYLGGAAVPSRAAADEGED